LPKWKDSASKDDDEQPSYNSKGLRINANGVVSMRELDLASLLPARTRDPSAKRFFNASLPFTKSFTVMSFIINGKHMPVEKHRDSTLRMILVCTAAQYSLSADQLELLLEAQPDELCAYMTALARNTQQVIRYTLYGQFNNFMNDKVLTQRDVYPSDDVKLHLGLTGDLHRKSFMEL
jgi:hypothetical protein